MLVRQAGCPNRSPGVDCEARHQDSLYRDWRRQAQIVVSIVVGNVGNRVCSTIQILVGKDVTGRRTARGQTSPASCRRPEIPNAVHLQLLQPRRSQG